MYENSEHTEKLQEIIPNIENVTENRGKFVCLFVFVALSPMSTAMVIAGRSVHLTTLFFLGRLEQAVNQ